MRFRIQGEEEEIKKMEKLREKIQYNLVKPITVEEVSVFAA